MQDNFLIIIPSVVVMMVHEKLCPAWIAKNKESRLGKARKEHKDTIQRHNKSNIKRKLYPKRKQKSEYTRKRDIFENKHQSMRGQSPQGKEIYIR